MQTGRRAIRGSIIASGAGFDDAGGVVAPAHGADKIGGGGFSLSGRHGVSSWCWVEKTGEGVPRPVVLGGAGVSIAAIVVQDISHFLGHKFPQFGGEFVREFRPETLTESQHNPSDNLATIAVRVGAKADVNSARADAAQFPARFAAAGFRVGVAVVRPQNFVASFAPFVFGEFRPFARFAFAEFSGGFRVFVRAEERNDFAGLGRDVAKSGFFQFPGVGEALAVRLALRGGVGDCGETRQFPREGGGDSRVGGAGFVVGGHWCCSSLVLSREVPALCCAGGARRVKTAPEHYATGAGEEGD